MGLLTEYPYICQICKLLAKHHHYRRLIKTLKVVIDRHSKKLLTMNQEELNIFIEILHDLITTLHAESTIPLDQEFENSVLSQYIKMVELILNQPTLNQMIPDSLKVKLSVMTISIYYDYSRFKQCEDIIDKTIILAQKSSCFYELIKLIIIRCNYVSLCSTDGDNNKNDIDDMIENVRTYKYNERMPQICDLFLRLLQIAVRMRFDECESAGNLLIQTRNDLLIMITKYDNKTVGKKRKLNEIETDDNNTNSIDPYRRPQKRQRLSIDNEQSVFISDSNSNLKNDINDVIIDSDICFLINFCALMHLVFIVRNSSFEGTRLNEMRQNIANLLSHTDVDISQDKMTYFERKLMEFFGEKDNDSSNPIDILCNSINGTYFVNEMIPLLRRTRRDLKESVLLQHIHWLNMSSLSSVIVNLFHCFSSMHNGEIANALKYINAIAYKSESDITCKDGIDFGTLHLKMLIWSICTHLSLCSHSNIDSNMMRIFGMMKNTDKMKKILKSQYCEQQLFFNYYRNSNSVSNCKYKSKRRNKKKSKKKQNISCSSVITTHCGDALIVFDETENEMDFNSLAHNVNIDDNKWMNSLSVAIANGDICNLMKIKSFLRLTSIKLHYLSSHFSLILRDRKCTRNQVKRVHRLTLKHVDVSSRFYIRLLLEVLRYGTFKQNEDKEHNGETHVDTIAIEAQKNQIKSIFNYIKQIFTHKNTVNVLPFVALCVIYSYITVEDDVIQQFGTDSTQIVHSDMHIIKRRITFLKFILCALLKQRSTQSCYLYIISSLVVYLYKLMQKCTQYQDEMMKLKQFIQEWIPKQMEFINDQLHDCSVIKQINAHLMQSFEDINIESDSSKIDHNLNPNINLNLDPLLKKVVVNYHDHIFVPK